MSKHALEDLEHRDTALPCKTLDPPIDDSDSAEEKKCQIGFYRNEEVVDFPCHPTQWNLLQHVCIHSLWKYFAFLSMSFPLAFQSICCDGSFFRCLLSILQNSLAFC